MRFGTAIGPVKHNVGGRYNFNRVGINVYGVFARVKRFVPNTLFITFYNVTMFKGITAGILTFGANKGVNNAYIANGYVYHIHLLYNYKPGVKVISTGQDNILLQTLAATGVDERYWVLVVFMPIYRITGNLA